jgi:hypothetical protein
MSACLSITGTSVDAEATLRALRSEARRRRVRLPPAFDVPDRSPWEPAYSAQARPKPLAVGSLAAIVDAGVTSL